MQVSTGLNSVTRVGRRRVYILLFCLAAGLVTRSLHAQATEQLHAASGVQLIAKPSNCVALHRGQMCFQRIVFSWTTTVPRRYCLFQEDQESAIVCAQGSQEEVMYDYASKSSERFILRQDETGPLVAELTINTAWVYRTGRRSSSSWRLF